MHRVSRGLTLLEVVLAAALLGIVGLAFVAIYPAAHRYLLQSMEFSTNQGEAGFAMEHIRRHLMKATAVTLPAVGISGGTVQFTWIPALAASPVTSSYQLNGQTVEYVEGAASPEPIARNVTGLTFTRPNNAQVVIQLQAQSGGNAPATGLETTVTCRGVSSP